MKLSDYMAKADITDAEMGALIQRDQSTVTRLRSGKTKPNWETLCLIASATYGCVTPNDFLPDDSETQSNHEQMVNGEAA